MSSSYEVAIGPNGIITRDSSYEYVGLYFLFAFAQNIQTVLWYQEDELTMNSQQWIRELWSFRIQTQFMRSNTFT